MLAGDVAAKATRTACTWDSTALTSSAEGDDSSIEVTPAGDGVDVKVSGATEWAGTGKPVGGSWA